MFFKWVGSTTNQVFSGMLEDFAENGSVTVDHQLREVGSLSHYRVSAPSQVVLLA